jgi:hypothetical protein
MIVNRSSLQERAQRLRNHICGCEEI